jgi:hypothetical protein
MFSLPGKYSCGLGQCLSTEATITHKVANNRFVRYTFFHGAPSSGKEWIGNAMHFWQARGMDSRIRLTLNKAGHK